MRMTHCKIVRVSIHAPVKGATSTMTGAQYTVKFQSTRP